MSTENLREDRVDGVDQGDGGADLPEPLKDAHGDDEDSCDTFAANEDGHYCLLHSMMLKNANLTVCDDWELMANG